jgi:hypothetical protein
VVAEKWYLARMLILAKWPNSKTKLKIKREIRAMKLLFSQKGNIS